MVLVVFGVLGVFAYPEKKGMRSPPKPPITRIPPIPPNNPDTTNTTNTTDSQHPRSPPLHLQDPQHPKYSPSTPLIPTPPELKILKHSTWLSSSLACENGKLQRTVAQTLCEVHGRATTDGNQPRAREDWNALFNN